MAMLHARNQMRRPFKNDSVYWTQIKGYYISHYNKTDYVRGAHWSCFPKNEKAGDLCGVVIKGTNLSNKQ